MLRGDAWASLDLLTTLSPEDGDDGGDRDGAGLVRLGT